MPTPEKIETLEDCLRAFEATLPKYLTAAERAESVDTFFAGMIAGIGIVSNRMSEIQAHGSISDFMSGLANTIEKTVADVIEMHQLFEGEQDVPRS